MSRILLVIIITVASFAAEARMYQWVDPDNGVTQLSGKPPVWYRSREGGPRVFVFENGKIIDDTGRSVSETKRESLRQQALLKAEDDKELARKKLLDAKRLQAMLNPSTDKEQDAIVEDKPEPEKNTKKQKQPPPATEQETVDKMKALIQEWESQRTQSARKLIQPGTKTSD